MRGQWETNFPRIFLASSTDYAGPIQSQYRRARAQDFPDLVGIPALTARAFHAYRAVGRTARRLEDGGRDPEGIGHVGVGVRQGIVESFAAAIQRVPVRHMLQSEATTPAASTHSVESRMAMLVALTRFAR